MSVDSALSIAVSLVLSLTPGATSWFLQRFVRPCDYPLPRLRLVALTATHLLPWMWYQDRALLETGLRQTEGQTEGQIEPEGCYRGRRKESASSLRSEPVVGTPCNTSVAQAITMSPGSSYVYAVLAQPSLKLHLVESW
ncbi:hypothetical protein F4782DRAFT_370254 [Xylaria castorea]|nr:hypothetical protein F4782DRAFT_370254 [Xylaria castorea]